MGARLSRPIARMGGEQGPLHRRIEKLGSILEVVKAMAAERDLDALLRLIVEETARVAGADRCTLFLIDRERGALYSKIAQGMVEGEAINIPLGVGIAGHVAQTGETVNLADAYEDPRFSPAVDQATGYRTLSLLCVPVRQPKGEIIGVLQVLNKHEGGTFDEEDEELLLALAGQGAAAIQNALHREEIEALFEGFVRASVVAIEARDQTTAGHSERVARLTLGLVDAVEKETRGPYAGLTFNQEQRQELRYAALLHDFGKVSVREEVLVKARKLPPTLEARVEARFDVIRASIEAEFHQRRAELIERHGPGEARRLLTELEREYRHRIDELVRFREAVHVANQPSVLPAERMAVLDDLARRTFRDLRGEQVPYLAEEELRFLTIPRGSLDERERREIESHVEQTYRFLSQIPWTDDLRNVAEIAYGHHEKLDGRGYPRGLRSEQIPVQTRIMTIADIFDALTASDRPYKAAVPTERALDIIVSEAKEGMLDPDLVEVLIQSGLYRKILEHDWREL